MRNVSEQNLGVGHTVMLNRCTDQILASPYVPEKNIIVKKKADFMFVDLKNAHDERHKCSCAR